MSVSAASNVSDDPVLHALPEATREFVARTASTDDIGAAAVSRGRAIASIVASLTDNDDIRHGALLFALLEAQRIDDTRALALFGVSVAQVATELLRLGSLSTVGARPDALGGLRAL